MHVTTLTFDIYTTTQAGKQPNNHIGNPQGISYPMGDMAADLTNSVGIVETKTVRVVEADKPLKLQCGKTLAPVDVAYETYGRLNEAGDNVILLCHALSGDAHVAGYNRADDKKGRLVGYYGRAGQGY